MADHGTLPGGAGWMRGVRPAPYWLGGAVLVVACAVLLGWILGGVGALVRIRADLAEMVPSTALSFGFLAASVILIRRQGRVAAGSAALILAVPCIVVVEFILHLSTPALPSALDALRLGGMSFATQFCMMAAALSLPLLMSGQSGLRRVGGLLATLGLIAALLAVVGYMMDARALYSVLAFSEMALHTATTFVLLFVAILLLRPEGSWARHILGRGRGSRAARRLIPFAFLAPLVIGYIALAFTQAGLLDENIRLALLTLGLSVLITAAIMNAAARANATEAYEAAQDLRLRSLLDGIGASVFAVDAQGSLRFTNAQAEALSAPFGGPQNWLRDAVFLESDRTTPLAPSDTPLARLLRGDSLADLQVTYAHPDGQLRDLRFLPGSYSDVRGERIFILTCRDVTEETRARADAMRAERLDSLGQLSGGIAHDIANLLGVIRLNADVGALKGGVTEAEFAAIQNACDRGADLTGRILAFAKSQPSHPEVVDLRQSLTETHSFLRRTVQSDIDLHLDLRGPISVLCERGLLENAVVNLVLNARDALVDAGTDAGRITLGLRAAGKGAVLFVEDNGPGMTQHTRDNATEPFFTTRQARGGTGLGLAIVDAFARNNGAQLALLEAASGGARIELRFDLRVQDGAEPLAALPGGVLRLDGLRILAVEDDPMFHLALESILVKLGADVTMVDCGPQALVQAESDAPFDLLLTDITLRGGMNGFEVAHRVARIRPGLPRMYLSGYAAPKDSAQPHPDGPFLQKPVSAVRLCQEIHKHLDSTR
ncbi:ATP-binding protein [Sulfitobacter sp. HNIBRBA3233]|uniref:hybrid sensor histidine kinase/response regulator n=1 Tax=Sulfitobacter marinivivus TaxID=3158558 RepID=UPI0032DF6D44